MSGRERRCQRCLTDAPTIRNDNSIEILHIHPYVRYKVQPRRAKTGKHTSVHQVARYMWCRTGSRDLSQRFQPCSRPAWLNLFDAVHVGVVSSCGVFIIAADVKIGSIRSNVVANLITWNSGIQSVRCNFKEGIGTYPMVYPQAKATEGSEV